MFYLKYHYHPLLVNVIKQYRALFVFGPCHSISDMDVKKIVECTADSFLI